MKLRLSTGTTGGENSYKKISEYGFQCVDFRMLDTKSSWYTCTHNQFEKNLKQEKMFADNYGLEIHQMHGPWIGAHVYGSKEELKKRLEEGKRSISACPYLGCKYWAIHPIFPNGLNDVNEGKDEDTYKQNYDFYLELLETAKKFDVTICYENMPYLGFSLSEVDAIKRMVDDINDEHFKVCLDTGHVNCFTTRNLGDAVRLLGQDLKVLHVHDSKYSIDCHLLPFFGTADWDSFYEGLTDIGFDGVFNLETYPSDKLNPVIFDEMSKLLVSIAKQILHEPI